MKWDWVVVGAGPCGCGFARTAAERGKKVLVLDNRYSVGGATYDVQVVDGLYMHVCGPHIFHTQSSRLWNTVNRFSDWWPYKHYSSALVNHKLVPLPLNLNSLKILIDDPGVILKLIAVYGYGARVPVMDLRGTQFQELADYLLDQVFRGYNLKQWGVPLECIDPSVLARIPLVLTHNDAYFPDPYQGLPCTGYTELWANMLSHPEITVKCTEDASTPLAMLKFAPRVMWTGALDYMHRHVLGRLPYRSIKISLKLVGTRRRQSVPIITYPNDFSFTRTIDYGHFVQPKCNLSRTLVTTEYPTDEGEPLYPVVNDTSRAVHKRYEDMTAYKYPYAVWGGRLADFRYYNMDQALGRGIALARKHAV